MRNTLVSSLLLLMIVSTSCHTRRRAQREDEPRSTRHATRRPGPAPPARQITTAEYVAQYKSLAIHQMRQFGIPASIILAQGILESNNGNSELARNANNHFGIKSTSDWKGRTYYKRTNEDNSVFRAYPDAAASYRDHSEFLNRSRYAALHKLSANDYKGWAYGLRKAGYATNPRYPQLLIGVIEKYELWKYD